MLTCQQTRTHLEQVDFIEESLHPEVVTHLSQCRDCQTLFEETKTLRFWLRNQRRVAAPQDFEHQLQTRLRAVKQERQKSGWFAWIPTPALAAVSAAVLLGCVFLPQFVRQTLPLSTPSQVADTGFQPEGISSSPVEPAMATPNPAHTEVPVATLVSTTETRRTVRRTSTSARHRASEESGGDVFLLVRDGSNSQHVVTVPRVIYGAQPILNTNAPRVEVEADTQHVF
jgi:hypothetical protein